MESHNVPPRRALVLGGSTGFIGRAISKCLSERGVTVHTLDRGNAAHTSLTRPAPSGFDWTNPETLVDVLRTVEPTHVVHAVGSASVGQSMENPADDFQANVECFRIVLEAVRRSALQTRVTLLSSAAVYGDPLELPISEAQDVRPISTYGFDKAMAEILARCYSEMYQVQTTVLRVFSVVGPEQHRLLPFELWSRAIAEPVISLQGSGQESRDFLHVDDLAFAVALLTERAAAPHHEVLNVASGIEVTTRTVATLIRDHTAPDKLIEYGGHRRASDPSRWRADISQLRREIPDWSPRVIQDVLSSCCDSWNMSLLG